MSYLEERLLKIIEMREKGTDEKVTAEQFGMCSISLRHYENYVKRVIENNIV